jgi:hypothetical protein
MRRRDSIKLVSGAVAAIFSAAHAQQATMPVVGVLCSASARDYALMNDQGVAAKKTCRLLRSPRPAH